MPIELEVLLSPVAYARLKDEAQRRQVVLDDVVRDVLESYAHDLGSDETDLGDLEDPSDEVILDKLRAGFEDIKRGRLIPARQALAELRRKFGDE